jgi:hypothetical protein
MDNYCVILYDRMTGWASLPCVRAQEHHPLLRCMFHDTRLILCWVRLNVPVCEGLETITCYRTSMISRYERQR